jgi:hypothetical protein
LYTGIPVYIFDSMDSTTTTVKIDKVIHKKVKHHVADSGESILEFINRAAATQIKEDKAAAKQVVNGKKPN